MCTSYTVFVEPFAKQHYIKKFRRKYKGAWDETLNGLEKSLSSPAYLTTQSGVTKIAEKGGLSVYKVRFRVAKTSQSKRSSGNRYIVAVHADTEEVRILLVYHKSDLGTGNETREWKKIVKKNYPIYTALF